MGSNITRYFKYLFKVDKKDRWKLFFLTLAYFIIIASYTLSKELKDSIFAAIVGKEYIPYAKITFMIFLVPAIFVYSKLVDKLRRFKLLAYYSLFYALIGLVFTYLIGHASIGLPNTDTSPYRIFGWIFYFFIEGFSPFVVGVFWAFANSVNDPNEAKQNYGLMVSGSKIGGILSAGLAYGLLTATTPGSIFTISDTAKHQILLGSASLLLLTVPIVIFLLMKKVSGRNLHGYEAAYKIEKKRGKEGKAETGILSGLWMFLKYPYVFGIFCIVFFYEVIHSVLSIQRVSIAQENSANISQTSSFLFKLMFITHLIGFLISLFGTKALLEKLGERFCLILIPVSTAILYLYFFFSSTQFAFLTFYVAMRSIHYGFSYPVRESLYIPTIKEVKFKSKSWIDAFGTKFAKSTGSVFNAATIQLEAALFLTAQSIFFSIVIGLWIIAAYLLGRRFDRAIANKEVIGVGESD